MCFPWDFIIKISAMRALRQVCVALNMHPINRPEVFVNFVHEKIDEDGGLKDDETWERIRELLKSLVIWTRIF